MSALLCTLAEAPRGRHNEALEQSLAVLLAAVADLLEARFCALAEPLDEPMLSSTAGKAVNLRAAGAQRMNASTVAPNNFLTLPGVSKTYHSRSASPKLAKYYDEARRRFSAASAVWLGHDASAQSGQNPLCLVGASCKSD